MHVPPHPVAGRAGEGPFGDPEPIAADPMAVVSVVHVGDAFEDALVGLVPQVGEVEMPVRVSFIAEVAEGDGSVVALQHERSHRLLVVESRRAGRVRRT